MTIATAAKGLFTSISLLLVLGANQVLAQGTPLQPMTQADREREVQLSWLAGATVAVRGPASSKLTNQAVFNVAKGLAFIPTPEAARIMRALGNTVGSNFVGLITSVKDDETWIAPVTFHPDGYIRDDDAKEWNADELLQNLKNGTEEGNKDRISRGFTAIEVTGWIEKPVYDSASHCLIWSIGAKEKGEPDTADRMVNYNTYVLGREGYFSVDFVTVEGQIEAQKPIAKSLIASLQFEPGKRYEDFNVSTDKVAAYGLAALVGDSPSRKLAS